MSDLVKSLEKFAKCEHTSLRCEKCGARSDAYGWQVFCGYTDAMEQLAEANQRLRHIRECLCGQGLEVAGWHNNGDLEPLDAWWEDNEWGPVGEEKDE
jgi:hypothetical protein